MHGIVFCSNLASSLLNVDQTHLFNQSYLEKYQNTKQNKLGRYLVFILLRNMYAL